ncbi:hypothetical protein [Streptococcus pneumoniae]|uniref:hypothetical protein n=1 Tax=Streptococcus pneumoniae TaxID=1313 RepID=UPI001CD971CC|nr:hypothetical protein [Streptococcus pneumoniae]
MKKTVYKKLDISIIASTLLASQLSTVSALSVISSTGEEYEVSETLEKGPESNDSSLSEISPVHQLLHFLVIDQLHDNEQIPQVSLRVH